MNALELANCIDEGILIDYGQVSDMLRQQHAEIESEKLYSSMKHDEVLALQAEVEALKKQNDDYWTMIEILRQRIRGNPLHDRLDEIAAGVVFGKAQKK